MANAFDLSATLDRTTVAPGVETELKVHLVLRAPERPATAPLQALSSSICLVFDCSASMRGPKLETTIAAARSIVDALGDGQRLSLVAFQSHAHLLVDNAPAADKETIKREIERVRALASGSTNLADGIRLGTFAMQRGEADAKIMVILSDGMADSPDSAVRAANAATAAGIQLFAVGIGLDYQADQLLSVVTPSNGAVFGESDLDRVEATLLALVGRIERLVATNAVLELGLAAEVRAGAGYKTSPEQAFLGRLEPSRDGRLTFKVGNAEAGVTYSFLVLLTAPGRTPGPVDLARAVLTYDVPALGLRGCRQELDLGLTCAADGAAAAKPEVVDAFRSARVAELAQELAGACRMGDRRRSIECLELLIRHAGEIGDEHKRRHYQGLLEQLRANGGIKNEQLNAAVVVGTLRPQHTATDLYDVVLLDPGRALIRVIREVRDVTNLDLRQVSDMVRGGPSVIRSSLLFPDAAALQKRIQSAGATVEVRRLGAEASAPG